MFRCEHGKDSDICVLCWEEKNLEPDTMKTKLQRAIENVRSKVGLFSDMTSFEFEKVVTELISLQSTIKAMRVENEERIRNLTLLSNLSNDQLKLALKECGEALKEEWTSIRLAGRQNVEERRMIVLDKALANPLVKQALENSK